MLTPALVRRLSTERNPAFLAIRQDVAIAAGALRQARRYPYNPALTVTVPGAAAAPAGGASPTQLSLVQEVEIAGQQGLRSGAAASGAARTTATVANAGRLMMLDATITFYRAKAAQQRLGVAQAALALTERLVEAVHAQLREGEVSALDANLAEVELGRARGRVLAGRREASSESLMLTRMLGLEPSTPVRLADDSATSIVPMTDSVLRMALANRPDIEASDASIREAESMRSLAKRQRIPNLMLGVAVERSRGYGSDNAAPRVGPALGLSVPLFNRYDGLVAQRNAEVARARFERQEVALAIRTEVVEALRAYESATSEESVFSSTVLEPARRNSALLETAYRAGKLALPSLLLLRNQLLDAELGYWDAWFAMQEARARLDAATGALATSLSTPGSQSSRPPSEAPGASTSLPRSR